MVEVEVCQIVLQKLILRVHLIKFFFDRILTRSLKNLAMKNRIIGTFLNIFFLTNFFFVGIFVGAISNNTFVAHR